MKERIIALADHPWQTMATFQMLTSFQKEPSLIEDVSMCVTDYYQFLHVKGPLSTMQNVASFDIETLEEIYLGWQSDAEIDFSEDVEFLQSWEQKNSDGRTLEQIAKANRFVFADEDQAFLLKVSENWKKRLLVDSIKWCESYISKFRPTIVICMEQANVISYIFERLCRKNGIVFLTFLPARINNKWTLRRNFGYGMPDEYHAMIQRTIADPEKMMLGREVIERILMERTGAYNSFAGAASSSQANGISNLKFASTEFRSFIGRMYSRVFIEKRLRSFSVLRFEQHYPRLVLWDMRRLVIRLTRRFGICLWGKESPDFSKSYFFWALHARPENSTSVLGDGRDEISELLKFADQLPKGYFLYVKENPIMLGSRRRGFYRRLRTHSGIVLIDGFASTFDLIEKCVGVVGISGTVLLEAAMFQKPQYALGKPEFDQCLSLTGWDRAQDFIEMCLQGTAPDKYLQVVAYVAILMAEDTFDRLPYYAETSPIHYREMGRSCARRVLDEIDQIRMLDRD